MKKIYSLLFSVALAYSAQAQLNVTNGSFETWEEGVPTGWTIVPGTNGGSITQETSIVQNASSSVKMIAPTGTGNNQLRHNIDFAVVPGSTYTISYYYYDQDVNARFRHWGSFRNADGALPNSDQVLAFQPSAYNADTTGWQLVTVSGVAPAGATVLRLDFRVFQQSATAQGGTVYLDNVNITGNLSTNENAIAGLKIYPNPASQNLYVSSDLNGAKSVSIFDVLGKQVVKTTVENSPINISDLKSGVYIVKVTEEGKTATRKLVVK